jgi:N-acetylglucosamine malate deacetylase 1
MKLDILAIGVHPDDVELGCSGTLINEIKLGKKVGVLDLTQGELGTRGTVETRYDEAASASEIMGIHWRGNLKMRDGFFRNDEDHQLKIISVLRKFRPDIVIGNILTDRHPDHGRAGRLIADACFLSGLVKIQTLEEGKPQNKWRPKQLLHYMQDWYHEPDLLVDISDVFDQRMKAIDAYSTQFHTGQEPGTGPQTYISTPDFRDAVIARARMLGKRIGVKFAEGFITEKKIGIRNLDALILVET